MFAVSILLKGVKDTKKNNDPASMLLHTLSSRVRKTTALATPKQFMQYRTQDVCKNFTSTSMSFSIW